MVTKTRAVGPDEFLQEALDAYEVWLGKQESVTFRGGSGCDRLGCRVPFGDVLV